MLETSLDSLPPFSMSENVEVWHLQKKDTFFKKNKTVDLRTTWTIGRSTVDFSSLFIDCFGVSFTDIF